MNKTKVTKRKGSKTKTDNGSAEVFVLPPNLLEQLGINIGNIGSASESTTESQVTDLNIVSNEKDVSGNKLTPDCNTCVTTSSEIESSIIETAKLMKKSVFLSPTFISQNTSVIQGEIEIAGNVVESEGLHDEVTVSLTGNEFSDKKMAEVSLDMQIEYESDVNVYKENHSPIVLSTQETEQCDQTANVNVSTLHDVQMQIVFDDHADEAYSSDGSNSNIACAANPGFNKPNKNKINIISEQIIDSSQFYKLKNSYSSSENSFIHVPINTKITSHKKNSSCNENILKMDLNPKLTTVEKPNARTAAKECNMNNDKHFVKGHTIPIAECDILQNIDKFDTSSVLNEISSEFLIIDQNHEDLQQDSEILQMFLKQDAFPKDKVAVSNGVAVPSHVDAVDECNIINKRSVDFPTHCEHHDDKVKELIVNDTDVDGKKDNSLVSKIISHDTKFELVDYSIATSCVNEPENESPTAVYPPEDENCNVKNNTHSTAHPTHEGGLQNMEEYETIVQKNGNLKNSEQGFINQEKEKIVKKEKQANQSAKKDLSVSQSVDISQNQSGSAVENQRSIHINNAEFSHMNQYNLDINKCKFHPVIEGSTESHNSKKQGPKINDTEYKKKDILEHGEVKREVKPTSNKNSYENNYADNAYKAPVIEEDKVREIAKYLSKFADMQKRNQLRERHGAVSITTLGNKKHIRNLKCSIQGVEKPGGSINKQIRNGPPIITYRRTRQKRCKTIPEFVQSTCADSHTHAQSIDVTEINSFGNVSKEMELCLCHDFGRLTSYDSENIYEHIHFWNNARSDGTPDIIFSIYNEDDHTVTIDKCVKREKEEYPSGTPSIIDRKLCWHEMKLTHKNKFDDFDNDCINKRNESIANYTHERGKHIPSKADLENVAKDECNKRQKIEKEPVCKNMTDVNLIQNREESPSNKIDAHEYNTKPGKKRKCSLKSDDNDDPPAKKYGSLFEQLPRTEQGRDYLDKDQPATNYKKTRRSGKKTGPSTSLVETTITFVEQTSSVEQPSLNKATANDANINTIERPSKPENEATANRDSQSSIVLNEAQVTLPVKPVTEYIVCGVCQQSVEDKDWVKHIATQHNYLAWKCGEPSVDNNDETAVRDHLSYVAKLSGGLECAKCGLVKKYAKGYLSHVRCCSGLNKSVPEVISEEELEGHNVKNEVIHSNDEFVKCGVCEESIQNTEWSDHIASRHDYLAWKLGEPFLDVNDEIAVREHLYEITKASGGLTCAKCGLTRKYVKAYLSHIRRCSGLNESQNDSTCNVSSEIIPKVESESVKSDAVIENDVELANTGLIKCGVCEESVETKDWSNHIGFRHDYLAWKDGDSPLDRNDQAAVKAHLYELTKKNGGLTCAKCGLVRKYVKAYLSHIKSCNGLSESQNGSTYNVSSNVATGAELDGILNDSFSDIKVPGEEVARNVLFKCGVCEQSVQEEDWKSHISLQHGYLAWKYGDSPLDVNDGSAVREHFNEITKIYGELTCVKCGIAKKTANGYLNHVKRCNGLNESQNDTACNVSTDSTFGIEPVEFPSVPDFNVGDEQEHPNPNATLRQCGVCQEIVPEKEWPRHISSRHDYLAWEAGEPALDVNDETAVKEHLYELTKKYGGLVCARCGLARKYVKAYLNHVKKCNGLNESQNDSACNLSTDGHSGVKLESANSTTSHASGDHGTLVQCAVCAKYLLKNDWNDHRALKHNYLAWLCGEQCLDIADDVAIRYYLNTITTAGGLRCAASDIPDVFVKSYVDHVKFCHGASVTKTVSDADLVKCGVCGQYMVNDDWKSHLAKNHEYLAWKDGEPPFNVDDKEETRLHLQNLVKETGALFCPKCGLKRKYAKSYLHHIRTCDGVQVGGIIDDDRQAELNQSEIEKTRPNKCGVCKQVIEENSLWIKHLSEEHNYLAWKDGDTPLDLDDAEQAYQHLYNLSKELGGLICKYCGKIRKYVKSYLEHVKNCNQSENDVDESRVYLQKLSKKIGGLCCPKCGLQRKYVKSYLSHLCNCGDDQDEIEEAIKCGVCEQDVNSCFWTKHLCEAHDYLAWKDGDTPLDLNDQEQVNQHLYDLSKKFGGLTCKYCGKTRKYVKSYLEHIKCCKNGMTEESEVVSANNSTLDFDDSVVDFTSGGICAVCQKEVTAGKWIQHTQKEHNYLAWREGEEPWNIEDFADVNQYLYVICKRMDGLTCNKCGIVRKYVKSYLTHIKTCNVTDFNLDSSVSEGIGPVNKDLYQCAMCKEHIKPRDWNTHAMKQHYNVTWIIGQTPIDIKNPYAVEKYLKDYKQVCGTLKCNMCGITRASFSGFYAHIITCKKSEEEIDMFRSVCEICNNKYLCIYKNQHAMIHKVQSYNAELKTRVAETKEEVNLSGKRRAAVKARSVIEKYSDNMSKHAHTCQSCGFGTDFKEELETHKCEVSNGKDFSGDESSAAELGSSDDESPDSDVDSNISNEVNDGVEAEENDDDEPQPKKRIRFRETASALSKVMRIPFKVEDPNSYIIQGDEDFCNIHFTDEVLYPRWHCKHEAVGEHELPRYLPPLEQSCKVRLSSDDWITLNRFGSKRDATATTIFVGASIVCISWAPLRMEDIDNGPNFLAIACHNGADCPRYQGDETPSHENLIQIWNYAITKDLPKLALGIAHDFGTVWSMDWCPSGARDALSDDPEATCRLGLLAVACSNGSAYIFSIPHPSTVAKNDEFIYKLKPVAELRMTMSSDRKRYQATSVSWSKQKGHTIILVGYADGSTAFYDLHAKSPLLCMMENDVEVLYPYHDERPHNTCITGTDLYPVSSDDATGCGAGSWVAPTGAQLATRAGAAGAAGRARLHVASLGVEFAPHAGSAVLAGDDAIMHTAISELVWVPPGRRLGPIRSLAGCARCGRVVASMPPTLRVMRPHPAYYDLKKQIVGMLEMTHLAKKRTKQVNDELAMTIEPLTYADAVSKYGLEFRTVSRSDRVMQHHCAATPKAHCPERFPLADVKSMAFCPSRKLHDKLAVATHAGILFLMTLK